MTTLDMLAAESASAIHLSVAHVSAPAGGIAPVIRAAAIWRGFGYAFSVATVGVAVVVALVIVTPTLGDPAQQVPTSSVVVPTTDAVVPTSVADQSMAPIAVPESLEPAPVVPPPVGLSDDGPVAADTTPPAIAVTSPQDGDRLETKTVTFTGTTEIGATVVASGKFSATVDADGVWAVSLVIAHGANGVVFVATDAAGNHAEVRIVVHLDIAEVTTTTTRPTESWQFTATQKYGSCELPEPYDVFSGKAEPGSTVNIASPNGDGSAVADGDGNWSVKVFFPTAVYNVTFTVTATDYTGATETFSFVSLYNG